MLCLSRVWAHCTGLPEYCLCRGRQKYCRHMLPVRTSYSWILFGMWRVDVHAHIRLPTKRSHRCGSDRHTLSRCRKPENKANPLPFAQCFVCSQKGHLAGSCPSNMNGLYPNGGGCKLCDQNDHLAKDCPTRRPPGPYTIIFTSPKKLARLLTLNYRAHRGSDPWDRCS